MGESNRRALMVVAAAIAILLTGCAVDAPGTSSTTAPSATAVPTTETDRGTSTPTIEPASWPALLAETSCEELAPEPVRTAVFGVELPPSTGYSNSAGARGVYVAAFENAGGLSCEWKERAGTDNPEDDRVVAVQLLPHSEAAVARISEEMGTPSVAGEAESWCNWRECTLNVSVGEYWVGARVGGLAEPHNEPGVPAEVSAVFDGLLETLAALPASAEPAWPETRESWPAHCEELVPEAELGAALGMSGAGFTAGYSYEGGNIGGGAFLTAGGLVCGLATSSGSRFGSILTLPGSAAAFTAARMHAIETGDAEAVHVAGIGADDAYLTMREDMPGSAFLSAVIDGTWFTLGIAGTVHGEPERAANERLMQLAERLAAIH